MQYFVIPSLVLSTFAGTPNVATLPKYLTHDIGRKEFESLPLNLQETPRFDFHANTKAAQRLLSDSNPSHPQTTQRARYLEDYEDDSFVSDYTLKFLGCHHVSQWKEASDEETQTNVNDTDEEYYDDNEQVEREEDDVRIMTKRLVRYRMCPNAGCNAKKSTGCDSRYGDYVVDIHTFVYNYLMARQETNEILCDAYTEICEQQCDGYDDDSCSVSCYSSYGAENCNNDNNDDGTFDPLQYAQCAQFDQFTGGDDDTSGNGYYLGPYCASQGGSIQFSLFTDNTCTTFSSCGEECFYETMGYELPYSVESLTGEECNTCSEQTLEQTIYNTNNDNEEDGKEEPREFCTNLYQSSGKCETKMYIDYPNESACTFIEGIKILREDGVIRTQSVKKSKGAALMIGLVSTISVCLFAYVYYLQTKLGRAKINLSHTAAGLT